MSFTRKVLRLKCRKEFHNVAYTGKCFLESLQAVYLLISCCYIPRWTEFSYKTEANLENPVQGRAALYGPSKFLCWCGWYSHFYSLNAELHSSMEFKAILWISHTLHSTIISKLWKAMCHNEGGGEALVQIVIWRIQQQLQHRLPCQTSHARVWINYTITEQKGWILTGNIT